MKLKRELIFFYASRFLGLALKPLALWCALQLGSNSWSEFFAKLFFIVPATFNVFNNDGHISYYKERFGGAGKSLKAAFHFKTYLSDLLSHSLLFSIPLMLFFVFYFKNPISAVLFLLFTLHEKFFDELLRFQLFSKRYDLWTKSFFVKASLPLLALMTSKIFPVFSPAIIYAGFTLLGTLAVAKGVLETRVIFFSFTLLRNAISMNLWKYFKVYRHRYLINQLATLLAINLTSIDKWVGSSTWEARTLGEIVLATQFGSIYLVLIDNLFFTTNRDRYVNANTSLSKVIQWQKLIGVGLFSIGVYGTALFFFKKLLGFESLSIPLILAVFLVSLFKGFARPLEEYTFWQHPRLAALLIDGICLFTAYLIGRSVFSVTQPLTLYIVVLGVILCRIGLYLILIQGDWSLAKKMRFRLNLQHRTHGSHCSKAKTLTRMRAFLEQ